MASGGFFKDVLIEDVLEWQKNIFELNPLHLNKLTVEGNNKFPFYGQSVMNNGIISYECLQDRVLNNKNSKPTILIHSNNQNLVYLETPFYLKDGHGATSVLQANCLTKNSALYLISIISKVIKEKFNYDFKATKIALKNTKIFVPYINQEPAFSYMDDFITELQAERLQELQGYLQVTGLSNYTLTEEEQRAIDDLDNVEWETFNIEKLFGKATRGKRLKSADRISGDLPFVTAGENDTGISAFIGNDVEVFKANTITIDMFGSAKYRNYQYGADDHIAVVHCDKLAKEAVCFLTSAIHKVSNAGQFSYAKNFYAKDADELNISLPTKNNVPDYALMKTLGSAVQKLVIADVVKYADRELSAYQSVIGE